MRNGCFVERKCRRCADCADQEGRPALDEMVTMDVQADLEEIRKPIPSTPVTAETIEQLFTNSTLLTACGAKFERAELRTWQLTYKGHTYKVTFHPDVFDDSPSLRLMNFGEPIFQQLIQVVLVMNKKER